MELLSYLTGMSIIILLGFISETLFDRTHIPDVLILFLFGLVIGPVLGYISPAYFANIDDVFVTLTLILIIFEGGLHIKVNDLVKGAYSGAALSFLFFTFSTCIVALVMMMFGYTPVLAILMGTILGGTSSAVVIPLVRLLKMGSEPSLILTIESTLTDVLCIVGSITVLEIIRMKTLVLTDIISTLLSTFLVSVFLGSVAGLFWFFAKNKWPKMDKAYMTTIAFIILLYAFMESLKSNGAIGILAFGIMLGNANRLFKDLHKEVEYHITDSEKNFYSELSFFVKVFFFVYLGIMIDFTNPIIFVYGAVITILLLLGRPFVVRHATFHIKDMSHKDRIIMGLMIPKGLAAAVLAQMMSSSDITRSIEGASDIPLITLSVILFSIIATSIMVFYFERIHFKKEVL